VKFKKLYKITKTVGIICLLFSEVFIPPIIVSYIYHDGAMPEFIEALVITLVLGIVLLFPVKSLQSQLQHRDGFLIIVIVWFVLSFIASIPFDLVFAHAHY